MMNKRGQTSIGVGIVMAIVLFITGSMVIDFFKDDITITRNVDNLDCSNNSISDGAKLTCLGVDIIVPYFFLLILSITGGVLFGHLFK